MQDGQGRLIDYLRISVTDRCNLRCSYCMPPQGVTWTSQDEILSYEEILYLVKLFAKLGIRRIRLTGGEPLVRRELDGLVKGLKALSGIETVSLTTNGFLLDEQLPALTAAGLDGINLSLDAVEEERYRQITGRLGAGRALAALDQALAVPGLNVKVNCVLLKENTDQLPFLAALAKERPVAVRFIELMPIGLGRGRRGPDERQARELLNKAFGPLTPAEGPAGCGPCRYFRLPGFQGRVGFISSLSHPFCSRCNRVRLTAQGFLKTCLQYPRGVDLKLLLRKRAGEEELLEGMRQAIAAKPLAHQFCRSGEEGELEGHLMSQIGG